MNRPVHSAFVLIAAALGLVAAGCGQDDSPQPPGQAPSIQVAAASSLRDAFEALAREFKKARNVDVVLAFGSSGKLAHQIENGAPFDVFAAADMSYVDRVIDAGAATAATRTIHARGQLVAWNPGSVPIGSVHDLAGPGLARIGLANPEHAPYGRAARQALERAGLWEQVKPRLVYGANVRQAMQYAETGNTDVSLTALSLVINAGGSYMRIDPSLYEPLYQGMVVIARSPHKDQARAFLNFATSGQGQAILARYGLTDAVAATTPGGESARDSSLAWYPLFLSLQVAVVATLISLILGVGIAALLSWRGFFGRDLLDALVTTPLVLPPTVLGYYVLVALGQRSPVGQFYEQLTGSTIVFTVSGAVVAATIGALPLVVKSARAALEGVDPTLVHAARTLGAGHMRAFITIRLPLAGPGIMAALMLAFARSLGDFGVTLMVAGDIPGRTQTASLFIYDAIQANRESAAAGMIAVLSAVAIFVLYAVNRLTRGHRGW